MQRNAVARGRWAGAYSGSATSHVPRPLGPRPGFVCGFVRAQEVATRISAHRMGDFALRLMDSAGEPLPPGALQVKPAACLLPPFAPT